MKQYYKFKGSNAFPENTIFERNENEFTPIMGAWTEDDFKKRSEGQGFDRIINLNTNFEEVMNVNPAWKQRGVILPQKTPYTIDGNIDNQRYEKLVNVFNKAKSKKKYNFNFTDKKQKNTVNNSDIDENYRKFKEDRPGSYSAGGTIDFGDYNEIIINPNISPALTEFIIGHELGHSIFDNEKIPNNLFNNNKKITIGEAYINKKETLADHFADYLSNEESYRYFYPNEAKFFDEYLNK